MATAKKKTRKTRTRKTAKKPARKTTKRAVKKTAVRKTRRTTTARRPARKTVRKTTRKPAARKSTTRRTGSKVTVRGVPARSQRYVVVDGSMIYQASSRLLSGARKHAMALQKKYPKKLFRIVDTKG